MFAKGHHKEIEMDARYSGNSTLIVPSVPTIFLGVAMENCWYLGDNKSVITLIPSQ
jgi:hypothetical protein